MEFKSQNISLTFYQSLKKKKPSLDKDASRTLKEKDSLKMYSLKKKLGLYLHTLNPGMFPHINIVD